MPQNNLISLNGNDTLIINGRSITDFAGALPFKGEFPNDISTVQIGKNGNTVIALKNSGKQMDAELNLIVGSDDDAYFNQLEAAYEADPPSFALMPITFTKRSGDGDGNPIPVQYIGSGGIFRRKPMVQDQAEGDSEQGIAKWLFIWPQVIRTVG
jgi:hypothetical protein